MFKMVCTDRHKGSIFKKLTNCYKKYVENKKGFFHKIINNEIINNEIINNEI